MNCPTCRLPSVPKSFTIGESTVYSFPCGHIARDLFTAESITSHDGKKLLPYQIEGTTFLDSAEGRALIADEMGLGKTVQALAHMKLHPEKCPFLIIVKSSLKCQWQHEVMRWCGIDYISQIIEDKHVIPGFKGYIVSFDLLRRLNQKTMKESKSEYYHGTDDTAISEKTLQNAGIRKKIESKHWLCEKLGIKTVIIDECQQIKNIESQRTYEVKAVCYGIENVIALSGTPIKNNAAEYFPILNILRPDLFPSHSRFVYNECDTYFDGFKNKTAGLRYPESFMRKTKGFILRRERKDVLPDLPQITRNWQLSDLSKEVEAAYIASFKEFRDEYNSEGMGSAGAEMSVIAMISKLRHLTGLSKVGPCLDYIDEFLLMTERKITVFVHHIDVGQILKMRCEASGFRVLEITGSMDSESRQKAVDAFKDPSGPRIMIASTLAAGEGLNMQFCSDCIMLERQWNPANEEQAEGRFIRIGQLSDKVTATYMVAVGTVDELFSELVERKREIVKTTLGGEAVKWDQSSLMKELAATLAASGGKRWGI